MSTRRDFLKTAAVGTAALGSAHIYAAEPKKITWRLQTYAGAALAEHVIKPSIDAFNKAANGQMEIKLYFADQLVPTGELFRAMQRGTIDAVQSDDDSIAAPVDVSVFGGYFPFATRYSLDEMCIRDRGEGPRLRPLAMISRPALRCLSSSSSGRGRSRRSCSPRQRPVC